MTDPLALVATFAHELAHYRTARFAEPPPGGWEVWEIATDLAAVYLGFGVFLANTRFQFGHFSDGHISGWRWRQQGYVSEPEVLHMQAIVSMAMGTPREQTLAHLKPALQGNLQAGMEGCGPRFAAAATRGRSGGWIPGWRELSSPGYV